MSTLAIFRRHVWMNTVELSRLPMYVVPTFAFPILLFVLFGLPYAQTTEAARVLTASYAAYGVIGVTLFQFGVGIAADRATSWEQFLRILPVSIATRMSARVVSALIFAIAVAIVVMLVGEVLTKAHLTALMSLELLVTMLVGAIPFAFLGITIGYWFDRRAAMPIANLIYLPLSLAGGLWMPPEFLPAFIAKISPYVPTRHYGEVVWAVVNGHATPVASWIWLIGYSAVFGVIAYLGYRRDESKRYI